jgi:diacylglycerol kinase (ATP)
MRYAYMTYTTSTFRNISQLAKVKIMKRPGSQWEELKIPRR